MDQHPPALSWDLLAGWVASKDPMRRASHGGTRAWRVTATAASGLLVLLTGCGVPGDFSSPSAGQVPSSSPLATPFETSSQSATPAPSGSPLPSAVPRPTLDPSWVTRPALWCGEGLRFPPEALTVPGAENWIDGAAAELRRTVREDRTPELPLPPTGWYRVADTGSDVLFVARGTALVPWLQVAVFDSGAGWALRTYGACTLSVSYPDGIGGATWSLDPGSPAPSPDSRQIRALIVETACASGKSPEGRVLDPLIVYGVDSVLIGVAVLPRPGGQDCQGNPEFPLTIVLSEPLGDRVLLDGSVFPPRVVTR